MKSISSVLKRRKKTRNIFLTKKQAYILHSIHRKGRGNNLCLPRYQQPQPLLPHPPQSRSSTIMIQQESLPLLQPHPFPHPLFPHRHIRQMIQRIQLQELSPKRLFPLPQPQLLLHPHLSSPHPQFVAAKSLIVNPPGFVYTSYYAVKALCVTYNYLRRETIFIST